MATVLQPSADDFFSKSGRTNSARPEKNTSGKGYSKQKRLRQNTTENKENKVNFHIETFEKKTGNFKKSYLHENEHFQSHYFER